MNYNELYKKYKKLLKKNKKLKKEISLYKQKYGSISDNEAKISQDDKMILEKMNEDNSSKINKVSSPYEKIELFISLFQGREDVYAHRWKSKNGKTGYSPVCINNGFRVYVKSQKSNVQIVKIENLLS